MGTAPVGAWLAVRGQFDSWVPIVLGAAVGLWVAGFDLIYALQDREFDREHGLKSFPAKFGEAAALRMAAGLHVLAVVGLGGAGWMAGLGWRYGVCWCGVCVVLWMESHWLRPALLRKEAGFRFVEVATRAHMAVSLLVLLGFLWEIFRK